MDVRFAPLTAADRRAVIDIFNHYVRHGFAAYPETPVPDEAFDLFVKAIAGYPALTARDEEDRVVGFAWLKPHHHWPTFAGTAEITYFLAPGHTGRGIGTRLLEQLLAAAPKRGIRTVLASISSLNEGSIRFHAAHGFVEVGRFRAIGRKHGRPFDVVWMQRECAAEGGASLTELDRA